MLMIWAVLAEVLQVPGNSHLQALEVQTQYRPEQGWTSLEEPFSSFVEVKLGPRLRLDEAEEDQIVVGLVVLREMRIPQRGPETRFVPDSVEVEAQQVEQQLQHRPSCLPIASNLCRSKMQFPRQDWLLLGQEMRRPSSTIYSTTIQMRPVQA